MFGGENSFIEEREKEERRGYSKREGKKEGRKMRKRVGLGKGCVDLGNGFIEEKEMKKGRERR